MAADERHWPTTEKFLELVRSRAIGRQPEKLNPPNLNDAQRILKGAGQYASMWRRLPRAASLPDNQLNRGLYPAPPRLDRNRKDPKHAFVVIKHGLRMTDMPAWGSEHGDNAI
ncbi:hypothetical protein ACTMU2_35510 (plasmid) [Cupriavidus basilensis]